MIIALRKSIKINLILRRFIMKLTFTRALLGAALLSIASITNAALIHSYEFNGNANDSVGTANGAVSGAALTNDRFGNANSAYLFNGNNYIDATFSTPQTATFSAWALLGSQSDTGDMLFTMNSSNAVDFWIYEGCNGAMWNTWDGCRNTFSGGDLNQVVRDGRYHHYTIVNDQVNNLTSLYIDGTLFGTARYKYAAGSNFRVGAAPASLSYGWDGVIDEIQVYNSALSGDQVSTLYANGSVSVPEPSTVMIFGLSLLALRISRR